MKDNNKRISFKVVDDMDNGWTYDTEELAMRQLLAMNNGFPEAEHMSDENREYWKNASKRHHVYKEVTIRTRIN